MPETDPPGWTGATAEFRTSLSGEARARRCPAGMFAFKKLAESLHLIQLWKVSGGWAPPLPQRLPGRPALFLAHATAAGSADPGRVLGAALLGARASDVFCAGPGRDPLLAPFGACWITGSLFGSASGSLTLAWERFGRFHSGVPQRARGSSGKAAGVREVLACKGGGSHRSAPG